MIKDANCRVKWGVYYFSTPLLSFVSKKRFVLLAMKNKMSDHRNDTFDEDARMVSIKYFNYESEAKLYALKLKEAGIPSFLSNTNMHGVFPLEHGGIGLHVREGDAPLATRILEGLDIQKESDTPGFSYDHAEDIDVEIEKGLIGLRKEKRDYTYLFIVGILAAIILVALLWHIVFPEVVVPTE